MKALLVLLALVVSTVSSADTLKDKDEAKELAHSVMVLIGKGKTVEGLTLTKPYLIIPSHEFEGVLSSLKMQQPIMDQRFGKTIGMELSHIKEVGDSLMLISYIQKFEKHVMSWRFYFYKPNNRWVLNTFRTDDNIALMFGDN
jgi:hypothetical protein